MHISKQLFQVFLDEVDACSYPGLLKEIIIDHSINGIVSDINGRCLNYKQYTRAHMC